MSDVVKGVLAGGWSLLVGWILPSALTVLLFVLAVAPAANARIDGYVGSPQQDAIGIAIAAVALGLLLAALQTPLYRVLEGYIGWHPERVESQRSGLIANLLKRSRGRQVNRKQVLLGRIDLVELSELERTGALDEEDRPRLAEVRADKRLERYRALDAGRTPAQLGLLREKLYRYPVDDGQIVPTRLGNAIRRFEEYGYDRFRLDSQRMWADLTAVAPERAVKEVDRARATVDFLICMLYGQFLVAVTALILVLFGPQRAWQLLVTTVVLGVLSWVWSRVAIFATDDWAAAVRSLVNLGRKPLAESLGLRLPDTLEAEREMWSLVGSLVGRPYHAGRRAALDRFRSTPPATAVNDNVADDKTTAPVSRSTPTLDDGLAGDEPARECGQRSHREQRDGQKG